MCTCPRSIFLYFRFTSIISLMRIAYNCMHQPSNQYSRACIKYDIESDTHGCLTGAIQSSWLFWEKNAGGTVENEWFICVWWKQKGKTNNNNINKLKALNKQMRMNGIAIRKYWIKAAFYAALWAKHTQNVQECIILWLHGVIYLIIISLCNTLCIAVSVILRWVPWQPFTGTICQLSMPKFQLR